MLAWQIAVTKMVLYQTCPAHQQQPPLGSYLFLAEHLLCHGQTVRKKRIILLPRKVQSRLGQLKGGMEALTALWVIFSRPWLSAFSHKILVCNTFMNMGIKNIEEFQYALKPVMILGVEG